MRDALLLGLDVGSLKSIVVLGDRFGNILARQEFATAGPEQTIYRMLGAARTMCEVDLTSFGSGSSDFEAAVAPALGNMTGGLDLDLQTNVAARLSVVTARPGRPLACGIACGGPLNSRTGMILSPPNLPGWDFVPIVKHVSEELGMPARLENDANAGALAEWRWGLGQRIDDLVFLTCGIGQGAGIVLDGRLHRGRQDLAGEIGHVRLLPLGPVGYHKAGSVEGLTSSRGLGELARLRLQEHHQASILDKLPTHALDGSTVAEAALSGDLFAVGLIKESACFLGRTCAILIDLLNPQRISLGGLAIQMGKVYVDEVRRCAREEALSAAFDACDIDAAALGDRIKDLSALAVASLAADEAAGLQTAFIDPVGNQDQPLEVPVSFDEIPGISSRQSV